MTRGCASRTPATSQNQLWQVKATCDLARLASGGYCTIIIINNTNLINCYSFHFSFQCVIKCGFLEIRCLYTCTRWMTQCLHTHAYPYKARIMYDRQAILCCEQSQANRRNSRRYLRSNAFNVVTQKYQSCRSTYPIELIIFLSYMEEFYLVSIAIDVTQNIFLSCSKIDLKIDDRLDLSPETIYYI